LRALDRKQMPWSSEPGLRTDVVPDKRRGTCEST
jgi:hypothetical protein